MNKILTILLIISLLPITLADIEEPDEEIGVDYKPSITRIGYYIKTTLPEFFISIRNYFEHDKRINWKLQQLEKRRIELEFLLNKLNKTTSSAWENRYKNLIDAVNTRQEQNLNQLQKYTAFVRSEKKEQIRNILEKRDKVLINLRERFTELNNTKALKGIETAISQSEKIREKIMETIVTLTESRDSAKKIIVQELT